MGAGPRHAGRKLSPPLLAAAAGWAERPLRWSAARPLALHPTSDTAQDGPYAPLLVGVATALLPPLARATFFSIATASSRPGWVDGVPPQKARVRRVRESGPREANSGGSGGSAGEEAAAAATYSRLGAPASTHTSSPSAGWSQLPPLRFLGVVDVVEMEMSMATAWCHPGRACGCCCCRSRWNITNAMRECVPSVARPGVTSGRHTGRRLC